MKLFFLLTTILFSVNLYCQTNVIFDTDIGSDCDDAGALAILHKLADKGKLIFSELYLVLTKINMVLVSVMLLILITDEEI